MRLALTPHPDFGSTAVSSIEVDVSRRGGSGLALAYELAGDLAAIRAGDVGPPQRKDGLWQSTCFEAFIRLPDQSYFELNMAPSGQWACYRFDRYREGMVSPDISAPAVSCRRAGDVLTLDAMFELPDGAALRWALGLSAVVEDQAGNKSYWAPAHPRGKPDFHHEDCFAAELPAPS
jgi:hypothetical protein